MCFGGEGEGRGEGLVTVIIEFGGWMNRRTLRAERLFGKPWMIITITLGKEERIRHTIKMGRKLIFFIVQMLSHMRCEQYCLLD